MKQIMKPATLENLEDLPVGEYVVQPKIDGIRFHIKDGVALSYTNKPLPNKIVQDWLINYEKLNDGDEGELYYGDILESDFQETSSIVMSKDKPIPVDLKYTIFDNNLIEGGYFNRTLVLDSTTPRKLMTRSEILEKGIEKMMSTEGAIFRRVDGMYKWGRATAKEGTFFKYKRHEDTEVVVVDYEVLYKNMNDQYQDETGHMVRSSSKKGKVAQSMVGKLIVEHPTMGRFKVGSGLTKAQRQSFYNDPSQIVGQYIKIKYYEVTNAGKPRHPVFLGVRDAMDFNTNTPNF